MAIPLLLLLAVPLTGCGGGDDKAGNGKKDTAGASAEDSVEQLRQYSACMREQGIDMPDPQVVGGGSEGKVAVNEEATGERDPQKFEAANQKCRNLLPNGGEPPKADAETMEQLRQFSRCMRENGVPNFPDPSDNGGIVMENQTDDGVGGPNDPVFREAQKKCADQMPGQSATDTQPGGGGK